MACRSSSSSLTAQWLTNLEGRPAVAARPQVVGRPGRGDRDAEAEAQTARHDEAAPAGVTRGGEDLDAAHGHVGKEEGGHAAEDAVGDGREERRDLGEWFSRVSLGWCFFGVGCVASANQEEEEEETTEEEERGTREGAVRDEGGKRQSGYVGGDCSNEGRRTEYRGRRVEGRVWMF